MCIAMKAAQHADKTVGANVAKQQKRKVKSALQIAKDY